MSRRGLVLDLDGTLVDSHAYTFAAMRHALRPFGVAPTDAEIHARFGPPERTILSEFVGADALAPAYARLQAYYARHARTLRVHAHLPPLLSDARRAGIGCALFTGRGADSTRLVLAGADLVAAFDAVVTGDAGVPPKPAPDGVLLLARRLGCASEALLVVGDSPLDILSARAAGAAALLATWFPLPQRPVPDGVDVVDDPELLRPRLGLPLTAPGS